MLDVAHALRADVEVVASENVEGERVARLKIVRIEIRLYAKEKLTPEFFSGNAEEKLQNWLPLYVHLSRLCRHCLPFFALTNFAQCSVLYCSKLVTSTGR